LVLEPPVTCEEGIGIVTLASSPVVPKDDEVPVGVLGVVVVSPMKESVGVVVLGKAVRGVIVSVPVSVSEVVGKRSVVVLVLVGKPAAAVEELEDI
jgi:hypothetical protein